MTTTTIHKLLASAGTAAAFAASSLVAGDYGKAVIDDKMPIEGDPWTICDIFNYNTLYESDSGAIRGISLHGRYHGNFVSQQEDVGGVTNNGFHGWYHRRFRLAVEVEFANDLKLYAESNVPDFEGLTRGPFFDDFQDLYIEWEPSDEFFVRIGKQKQHFTREDIESSKRVKTVERSHIVNETAQGRPWGLVVGFETGDFSHEVGGWLYGAHAENPNWIDFDSNGGFSYNLGYDLNETTDLFFDYVYADNNGGATSAAGGSANNYGPAYEHAFALGAEYEQGRLEVMSDIVYALNRSASGGVPAGNDTWGFYIVPSYDISDNLEAVFRYGYMAEGRNHHTQRFPVRQAVENYHTFYVGLQYFICGEKLKLQGGYEYATGDLLGTTTSIDSGSWMFGVRAYF